SARRGLFIWLRRNAGAGEGNRTLVISLEGCCSTIELHPPFFDSGPPPPRLRRTPFAMLAAWLATRNGEAAKGGGGGWTRTNEAESSGFTVRPLCHSGHSPTFCTENRGLNPDTGWRCCF